MGIGRTAVAGRVTTILAYPLRDPSEQHDSSLDDMEFEFLDDGEMPLVKSSCSDENEMEFDEEETDDDGSSVEDNRRFWENQHQILQETLRRSSSLESRIRNTTKEALKEIKTAETMCNCVRQFQQMASKCRQCLMRQVSGRLLEEAYDVAICRTKWRSSPDIPSGEHNFLDVIDGSSPPKGEVIRVIIELNFRAEFEMARASDDYNRLVRRLPEVFVGKVERLSSVIKIMCVAGKKCMKEKKMHMGPWRKHKYMLAKWLGIPWEREASTASLSVGYSERLLQKPKPKASMLTVDLVEKLPNRRCAAVEVV